MKPIRVLHVVTKMDAAGIETLLMNFYRNIDRSKIQFDFLTHRHSQGFYDNEIRKLGGHIYNVPSINPFKHTSYLKALDSFFAEKRTQYNIVHSHINTFSMYPLRAAKKVDIPVRIAHSHIANVPLGIKTPFRLYTKLNLKKYTTHHFACSDMAGKWLYGKEEIYSSKYKVIKNSIDAINYRYNKETEKIIKAKLDLKDKLVLGHIGRFTKQKNHEFLIEIFKEVYKKNSQTRLVLIGEGELQDKIKKRVAQYNLQHAVYFLGVKSNISEIIQSFDVFILPSLYEGLGIVAIEAQAAGIPCIVSDKVPKEAYITDLVKSISLKENPEVWASNIITAMSQKKVDTYNQILESGYDVRIQARKLMEFYLEQH